MLKSFDVKRDFARECSEVCLCKVNRCVNRATQVAPRVLVRDDTQASADQGHPPRRLSVSIGRRTERQQNGSTWGGNVLFAKICHCNKWDFDYINYLFRYILFVFCSDRQAGCECFGMCYKIFRSAAQYGGPAAVCVVPVMVLQSPFSVHIGNPLQLAIFIIALASIKAWGQRHNYLTIT